MYGPSAGKRQHKFCATYQTLNVQPANILSTLSPPFITLGITGIPIEPPQKSFSARSCRRVIPYSFLIFYRKEDGHTFVYVQGIARLLLFCLGRAIGIIDKVWPGSVGLMECTEFERIQVSHCRGCSSFTFFCHPYRNDCKQIESKTHRSAAGKSLAGPERGGNMRQSLNLSVPTAKPNRSSSYVEMVSV